MSQILAEKTDRVGQLQEILDIGVNIDSRYSENERAIVKLEKELAALQETKNALDR